MSYGFGNRRESMVVCLAAHVEQHGLLEIEQVAGLGVLRGPVFRCS
jgi:hypothetical protein